MNIRDIITIMERSSAPKNPEAPSDKKFSEDTQLDEVDRAGAPIPQSAFHDELHQKDFTSDQLDLFMEIPAGEPKLPEGYKLIGRMGQYFVALQKEGIVRHYVWFTHTEAVSYVSVAPWSRERLNYARNDAHRPDLNGVGYRIDSVMVREKFQGQGLGPKMYEWLLQNECDYIMADESHTRDGERLWKRLMRMKGTFAVEVWNGDTYESRRLYAGFDFNRLYDYDHLIPWVTLRGRETKIRTSEDD